MSCDLGTLQLLLSPLPHRSSNHVFLAIVLGKVPACRSATQYLGDVMGQQSWEARAFGVRAAALLAERFPTEEVGRACFVNGGHRSNVFSVLLTLRVKRETSVQGNGRESVRRHAVYHQEGSTVAILRCDGSSLSRIGARQ